MLTRHAGIAMGGGAFGQGGLEVWFCVALDFVTALFPSGEAMRLIPGDELTVTGDIHLMTFSDPQSIVSFSKESHMIDFKMQKAGCGSNHEHTDECVIGQMIKELAKIEDSLTSAPSDVFYVLRARLGEPRSSAEVYSDDDLSEEEAKEIVREMRKRYDGWWYFYKPASGVNLIENMPRFW